VLIPADAPATLFGLGNRLLWSVAFELRLKGGQRWEQHVPMNVL
jgi:hypothetical protein